MKLYEHQKKIIQDDPKRSLIALGTGGGKTRVCLELADGRTYVVCPKQQKLDQTWEQNADKFGISKDLRVFSKEEFRRDHRDIGPCDTLIIDECHFMLGMLPDTQQVKKQMIPKSSQMFKSLLWYIREYKPKRIYLASATPASKAMNVFALAAVFGKVWDFYKFRELFYFERKMGYRTLWIPQTDKQSKDKLAKLVKSFGYTGQLSDWFDVPEQTHKTIYVSLTKDQRDAIKNIESEEADPMSVRAKKRTIENGCLYTYGVTKVSAIEDRLQRKTEYFDSEKIEHIRQLCEEFDKVLIFCAYIGQIKQVEDFLKKEGHRCFVLTGATKERGAVISDANKADSAVVIAQAGISAGYELPSFPCVIFASKSYKYLDYEQGKGRVLRANALKKNLYVHLVVKGGVDEDCHKAILAGQDFHEKVMEN